MFLAGGGESFPLASKKSQGEVELTEPWTQYHPQQFHPPPSNSTLLPSLYAQQTAAFVHFTLHCHIFSHLILYLP
jgi:hypothetical protein